MSSIGRAVEIDLVRREVIDRGQTLVTGEAGIGKSTMLDLVAEQLQADGFVVARVAGSPGLIDHPLTALGHLVGDVGNLAGPALTALGVARLRGLERGDRAVIVADDAHELDVMSLYVIGCARAEGGPRVLMASRGGADLRPAVAQFGRFPGTTLELQRLSARETADVAGEVLGAPLDTPSADRIYQATDGLPLAVDELLRSALSRRSLVLRAGLYRWDSTAVPDRHLAGLLGLRVDDLGRTERLVIDALAIAGDLPATVMLTLSGRSELADLETQRLVRLAPRPGWVSVGHPLLRDAALGLLGPIRRREIASRLVDLLDGTDVEEVRLRVVLAVEAGVEVSNEELARVAAWGRAHGLWTAMLPVMQRAWLDAPSAQTGLAYGEALYWSRQMDHSDRILLAANALCTSQAERVALATARARTLEIGLGRSVEAAGVRAEELARTVDPAQRLELWCAAAERDLFDGRVDRILEIADRITPDWDPTHMITTPMGAARYRLSQSMVGALGLSGQMAEMSHEYRLHLALSEHHAHVHPTAREVVDPWWVAGHLLAGDPRVVVEQMEERYAEALMIDDGLSRPLWALPRAIERWLAGDLAAAEHFAREAMGVPEAVVSIRRMATHFLARILDLAGHRAESVVHARATSGDDYVGIVRRWSVGLEHRWLVTDPAFVSPSSRQTSEAMTLAATDELRREGQLVAAAWVAHDLVRAGSASSVVDRLTELVSRTDAPAVRWISDHAVGRSLNDGWRLAECAKAAASAGCFGVAMIVAEDSVDAMTAQRDVAGIREAESLVAELRSRTCGFPEPSGSTDINVRLGLSPREAEVARAAGAGLTDQQISDELFISVRTVNAHLRAVYRKLGVSGRHELVSR